MGAKTDNINENLFIPTDDFKMEVSTLTVVDGKVKLNESIIELATRSISIISGRTQPVFHHTKDLIVKANYSISILPKPFNDQNSWTFITS